MRLLIKSTYFLIGIIVVIGQDDFGTENGGAEYQNIFKNIPTLFEYMLETLEEKPEVLEKNDANVFKVDEGDDVDHQVLRFQRSANEDVENRKVEEKVLEKTARNDDKDGEHNTVSGRNGPKRIGSFEGKTIEARPDNDVKNNNKDDTEDRNVRNDKRETVRKESDKTFEISTDKHEGKSVKRGISNDSETKSDDEEEVSGTDVISFDAKDTTWRLTSEEIAQQALRVEEMLEKHNSSRK